MDGTAGSSSSATGNGAVAPRRVTQAIVMIVVAVFVLGHAYDIGLGREHWPFSRYGMYATMKPKKTSVFEVYGIRTHAKGGSDEVKLQRSQEFIVPLAGFKRIYGTGKVRERKRLAAALSDFYKYYEFLRKERDYKGGQLRGMRLYRTTFFLKDDAGNATRPDIREVLAEVGPTGKPTTRPTTQRTRAVHDGEQPGDDDTIDGVGGAQ